MTSNEKKDVQVQTVELAVTAASSLVGFAIGGPIGAVVGGVTTPVVALSRNIVQMWTERRKKRLSTALDMSFSQTGLSDEEVLLTLTEDTCLSDDVIRLLRQLVDTDPELDLLFSTIIASMIQTKEDKERKRLLVLSDAIKGLNDVQIQIIKLIATHGFLLSASDIALGIDIPEVELRNAVRDMELRGIITDNNSEPTVWELRELGKAINTIAKDMEDYHGC